MTLGSIMVQLGDERFIDEVLAGLSDIILLTRLKAAADAAQEPLADFAAALAADEQAGAFFSKLSNSMQRYHIDTITAAKSADTRQRRIDKAIALFRAGKQR